MRTTILTLAFCLAAAGAQAKVRVVTTTEDLASLARAVGGGRVAAQSLARGYMDPHFVDAKPSYLLKLRRADLFIEVGLELEVGWAPSLLTRSRNPKILPGHPGFMDASDGCRVLQKRQGGTDRSQGDVHPLGNPHFWLDPKNGLIIARRISERLAEIDPQGTAAYEENLKAFEKEFRERTRRWDEKAAGFKGLRVVTYHNSWPNFAERFGIEIAGFVESKPGIPPSPAHVRGLIAKIKREKIPIILVEPYFDMKMPKKIARNSGAKVVVFPPSVGSQGVEDYFGLFDRQLDLLSRAAADAAGRN